MEPTQRALTVETGKDYRIDVTLPRRATVSGRVVDSAGKGIPGVCVHGNATVPAGGSSGYGSAVTDATGHYSFRPPTAGSYNLSFNGQSCGLSDENLRTFMPEQRTLAVESGKPYVVDATLLRRPTISGQVVDPDGKPVADICVSTQAPYYGGARTDADGRYRMTYVSVGEQRVQFSDCSGQGRFLTEWHLDQRTAAKANVVTVAPEAQIQLATAQLARAGRITGSVTDETTGKPLGDVCVSAHDRAGLQVSAARTNTDGAYAIGGLPTASYRVQFVKCSPLYGPPSAASHESEWHRDAISLATATPVSVTAGATLAGLDASLRGMARVAGTVTDESGTGVSGVCVLGVLADGREFSLGQSDISGDFTSSFVPAGDYRVRYTDCSVPVVYATRWFGDALTADGATVVTLSPNAYRTDLDQRLSFTGTLRVTAPNGGERLARGSVQTIRWDHTGPTGPSVKVELMRGTSVVSTLAASHPVGSAGKGELTWTPAKTLKAGADYRVRVTSTTDPTVTDVSDAPFSVT